MVQKEALVKFKKSKFGAKIKKIAIYRFIEKINNKLTSKEKYIHRYSRTDDYISHNESHI